MKKISILNSVVIFLAMCVTSILTPMAKPIYKMADLRAGLLLEDVIPKRFGQWRMLPVSNMVVPNPQTTENLKNIYTQLLMRSYVNSRGDVVMLSLAYGEDQRSDMAVHYPEVCYPAQGFSVLSNNSDLLSTVQGTIPIRRLETKLNQKRYEPVTYWTTIGNKVSLGGLDKRLIELEYGVKRQIPDGLLFRISSIDFDTKNAFKYQNDFAIDLISAVEGGTRDWLIGKR